MSKLENKPLIKLLGPFFQEKLSETIRKQLFMLFVFPFWGYLGTPNWTRKGTQKACKWAENMAQCLSLEIST
jgi:hypothetical protein